jgi:hypothetical protein
MAPNVGKHNIYIIEVAGEFRVRPAVAMVEGSKAAGAGGDKELSIRNTTGYPAIVVFDPGFTQGNNDVFTLTEKDTPGSTKAVKLSINANTPLSGNYPYSVMIRKGGDLIEAKGESAPSVIVDP